MSESKSSFIHQDHENRITRLEVVIENINNSLTEIKNDVKRLDNKIDSVNNSINNRLDSLNNSISNRLDSNFKWLLGMMIGGFASILAVVAHAQHGI